MNPEQEIVTTPTSEDDLIKTLQQFYVESGKKIKFQLLYLQYLKELFALLMQKNNIMKM